MLWLACGSMLATAATRVFVEPFGNKAGAAQLRAELVSLLQKQAGVEIVPSASNADFILAGSGETYIKGYLSSNPRVRYLNSDARPIYSGFLSVELKNHAQDTLWSYLVTPSRFGADDINRNLASQMTRRLVPQLQQARKPAKP
jgi:hypothetical protein